MDTQNELVMALSQIMQQIPGHKVIVGSKQLRKALNAGKASRVYLACNADPAITEPLAALCQQKNVDFAWVRTMSDLGRACGIEVGAAAAALIDQT